MARGIAALLVILFLPGCGPTFLLPGGALTGTSSSSPTDWAWTDDVSTIQLETRPEDPYSVNLWVVGIDDGLYIHAGANRAAWVEHIEVDSLVRVRIEEKIYALSASRIEDQREFDAFSEAYDAKYGIRPRHEDIREVYLFRLAAP